MADLTVRIQAAAPRGYKELRQSVSQTLVAGQKKIEALKVQIYWQTGKLISDYLKRNPEDAAHGSGVVERLSADLNIERSVLYRLIQFHRCFPNVATWRHLTWSHYRALLAIEDDKVRGQLVQQTFKNQWPVTRLLQEIKQHPSSKQEPAELEPLTEPEKGKAGAVQVAIMKSLDGSARKVFDLGFADYREMTASERKRFQAGDMARQTKAGWVKSTDERDRWFYAGEVEYVVDGDTLMVQVQLLPGIVRRQYLRLLHINAEELGTAGGEKAKRWLQRVFKKSARLEFRSHKTDRYDRYLADVWAGGRYLNAELFAKGLAVRV